MKISYANITLNPSGCGVKNFTLETKRECRTESTIDSDNASIFDRKNSKANATITIERSHKSEADAEAFTLEHAQSLSSNSPATLEFLSAKKSFILKDAVLVRIKIQNESLTTVCLYEFTGTRTQQQ